MKKYLIILFALFTVTTFAQTHSQKKSPLLIEALPETVGMSSERLNRIDTMLENAVTKNEIPGAVAMVVRNGKIVYYKAFGMADNESNKAMKRDDIFRIASQTKAITATAIMMLWEEGKFQLDDPISKYIPEFKNPQVLKSFDKKDTSYTTVPAKTEITIRQLLSHTSGIGYGDIDDDERFKMLYHKAGVVDAWTSENISIADNIKRLAKLPLHFNPGEKYYYSNGLDVLGYLIEIISGMPLDVYLRIHLFEPLDMKDTWFYLPQNKAERLVSLQKPQNIKWIRYPITYYDPNYPITGAKKFFPGGSGLSGTAKDYANFLQMYLNGGEFNGKRFLSRTTIQTIMTNQTGNLLEERPERYYGLVFSVINQKGEEKGSFGSKGTFLWGGHFNTDYFADPKEKVIGIIMKQTQDETNDNTDWKFRILVEQAIDD